jgi:diguanylate cyclase (GGDEF)-like protein
MNLDEAIQQLGNIVEEIKQAAFADDKTPLGNASALRQQINLIESGQSDFDVILFGDLNDFKTLNDLHGHEAGDIAINQVGDKINQIIIEKLKAKAFRPSGDEFVILLKRDLIKAFLQESKSFAAIPFSYKEKSLKTQMSFGYSTSDGKTSFSDLLERAENACQIAKMQGDGVCIEWTKIIEQKAFTKQRGRCRKCEAKVTCEVPKQNAPKKLLCCPCCGEFFEKP